MVRGYDDAELRRRKTEKNKKLESAFLFFSVSHIEVLRQKRWSFQKKRETLERFKVRARREE